MAAYGPRVHFTISSHGYGHLSQSAALIRELIKKIPEINLGIQCNLDKKIIAERIGNNNFSHEQCSTDIGLIQKNPITPDLRATYKAYQTLHHNYNERVEKESNKLKNWHPDLVISDIPYLPIAAASHSGIPAITLASLSWDYIIDSYFDIKQSIPGKWYADAQASYNEAALALLPSPAMNGDCFDNIKHIPPVAVLGKRQARLRSTLNIKSNDTRPLIFCSLGGITGSKLPLSIMKQAIDFHWLISNSDFPASENMHYLDDCNNWQYKDVIASVDGVISKPGYGMAVEAAAHGLPIVFFRRGHFPDEALIINWLHRHTRAKEISREAWFAGEFVKPLIELFNTPIPRPPICNGAEVGASIIKDILFS